MILTPTNPPDVQLVPARSFTSILAAAILVLAGLVGAFFAARSAYYGLLLARPIPMGDQWGFTVSIPRIYDGSWAWADLFALHNEHRIAVSRVLFLADLFLFDLTNYFLIASIYGALAFCAFLLTWLGLGGERRPWPGIAMFSVLLGLFWSVCQWENLGWGFQPHFPLILLFGLAACWALARALVGATLVSRLVWSALAIVADFLCIFTLAAGISLVGPLIMTAVLLRRFGLPFLVLLGCHAVFSVGYLLNAELVSRARAPFDPLYLVKYSAIYLGSIIQGDMMTPALVVGGSGLLLFVSAALVAAWSAIFRKPVLRTREAIALSFASFPVCMAILSGIGRGTPGYFGSAMESRYSTASAGFIAALAVFLFLLCGRARQHWLANTGRSAVVIVTSVLLTWSNLVPTNLTRWFNRTETMDAAIFALLSGVSDPGTRARVHPIPSLIAEAVNTLIRYRLGPFSPLVTGYTPPTILPTTAQGADCANLSVTDVQNLGSGAISARLSLPNMEYGSWLVALNGEGRRLGFVKSDIPSMPPPELFMNAGIASGSITVTLVLLPPHAAPCRTTRLLSVSELELGMSDPYDGAGSRQAAPGVVVSTTGDAQEGAVALGIPDAGIFGPAKAVGTYGDKANAGLGSIEMRVPVGAAENRKLVVPVLTGPGASGLTMTVATATKQAVTSLVTRNPHIWRPVVVPRSLVESAQGGVLTVTLKDTGTGSGEWLAALAPLWQD